MKEEINTIRNRKKRAAYYKTEKNNLSYNMTAWRTAEMGGDSDDLWFYLLLLYLILILYFYLF